MIPEFGCVRPLEGGGKKIRFQWKNLHNSVLPGNTGKSYYFRMQPFLPNFQTNQHTSQPSNGTALTLAFKKNGEKRPDLAFSRAPLGSLFRGTEETICPVTVGTETASLQLKPLNDCSILLRRSFLPAIKQI